MEPTASQGCKEAAADTACPGQELVQVREVASCGVASCYPYSTQDSNGGTAPECAARAVRLHNSYDVGAQRPLLWSTPLWSGSSPTAAPILTHRLLVQEGSEMYTVNPREVDDVTSS